jgi:RNA polymerase sigma-70 factor (family 1)
MNAACQFFFVQKHIYCLTLPFYLVTFVFAVPLMSSLNTLTDIELTGLLKSGDHAAFTEIYHRFSGLLYTYSYKLTRDTAIAQDMVQDLFISLWDKRDTITFNSSLSGYLYTTIRYKFLKQVAHEKVKSGYAEDFISYMSGGSDAVGNYISDKELILEVEKLVAHLPKKMARIFIASRLEYRSHKEIAAEMNLSEKTIKNVMSQAVKNIRLKIGAFLMLF